MFRIFQNSTSFSLKTSLKCNSAEQILAYLWLYNNKNKLFTVLDPVIPALELSAGSAINWFLGFYTITL